MTTVLSVHQTTLEALNFFQKYNFKSGFKDYITIIFKNDLYYLYNI
jgi:hypothetical protein